MHPYSESDDVRWRPTAELWRRLDVVGDPSPCGRAAMEWAADLAARAGVRLHLVTWHRPRWHAFSLPPPVVARLVSDHELRTLVAAEEVMRARGVEWRFSSVGSRSLRDVVPPTGGLLVVPRHRPTCTDRVSALRTLPHPRRAASALPRHVVVTVGPAPDRHRTRVVSGRLLPLR